MIGSKLTKFLIGQISADGQDIFSKQSMDPRSVKLIILKSISGSWDVPRIKFKFELLCENAVFVMVIGRVMWWNCLPLGNSLCPHSMRFLFLDLSEMNSTNKTKIHTINGSTYRWIIGCSRGLSTYCIWLLRLLKCVGVSGVRNTNKNVHVHLHEPPRYYVNLLRLRVNVLLKERDVENAIPIDSESKNQIDCHIWFHNHACSNS